MLRFNVPLTLAFNLWLLMGAIPALATPEVLYDRRVLGVNLATCKSRAAVALQQTGFPRTGQVQFYWQGYSTTLTALIDCKALGDQTSEAIVIVAGETQNDRGAMATVLVSLIDRLGNSRNSSGGAHYGWGYSRPAPQMTPLGEPMDGPTFAQFLDRFRQSWPDYSDFLAQTARDGTFTADQVRQLIAVLKFSTDQEDVAVLLYPRVLDKNNWFLAETAFIFPSSAETVRRRVLGP
jgi:hypothetical protein